MTTNPERARLLFVDDEESIRVTLGAVLQKNGFDVSTAGTVADALTQINSVRYDVLLCDLNIEKPGDGFAVIGAMRYAQPHCVSLILTAYPSFENAMQAIEHQVDEFFTKPADLTVLVASIRKKLEARRLQLPVPFRGLSLVLRENCADIVAKVTAASKSDPIISGVRSFGKAEANGLPKIMDALIQYVEVGRNGLQAEALKLGAEHGRVRKKQGYDALMMMREFQLIGERICELIARDRVPGAPVAWTSDLAKLTRGLNALAIEAVKPYIGARQTSRA